MMMIVNYMYIYTLQKGDFESKKKKAGKGTKSTPPQQEGSKKKIESFLTKLFNSIQLIQYHKNISGLE